MLSDASHHRFQLVLNCLSTERHFKAVMGRFVVNSITIQKKANLGDLYLTRLLSKKRPIFKTLSHASKSKLFLWCLSSERPFGAVTVKFSLNTIRTQKMENLQNGVRRLEIIVFSQSYRAYLQSDIFQHLQKNSHLSLLRPKAGHFIKYCHTPLNHPCLMELIITVTFYRSYGETLTSPDYY